LFGGCLRVFVRSFVATAWLGRLGVDHAQGWELHDLTAAPATASIGAVQSGPAGTGTAAAAAAATAGAGSSAGGSAGEAGEDAAAAAAAAAALANEQLLLHKHPTQ